MIFLHANAWKMSGATSWLPLTIPCAQWLWIGTLSVYVGVKQGCVLAPVIFNIMLVALTLTFRNDSACRDAIGIKFRDSTEVFSTHRRLHASTIFCWPHNLSSNTRTMHLSLDNLHLAYERAGLVVNTKKTEVLSQLDSAQAVTTSSYLALPASLTSAVFLRTTANSLNKYSN